MAYSTHLGTRVGVHINRPKQAKVPCIRCGVKRHPNHDPEHKTSGLCRDCRYSMSTEEIRIWSASSTETV